MIALIIIFILSVVLLSTLKIRIGVILSIYLVLIYTILFLWGVSRWTFEKILIVITTLFIPFLVDLNVNNYDPNDYHMVTKEQFKFNFLHIIVIFLLIEIIRNRKKVKIGFDLFLIFMFNIICVSSIFYALNHTAAFFDYTRYFYITVIYIYFSRIFDIDKHGNLFIRCIIIGLVFQLSLGILQKIIGEPLGLYFLGEGREVFRVNVSGYEKGMSGTFGHPGPYALYGLCILSWMLYDTRINNYLRKIGIIISTLIIILAAGRTSILLMMIIYFIYMINRFFYFNVKNILRILVLVVVLFTFVIIFKENLDPIIERFTNSDMDMQFNSRMIHYNIAMYYISQKPIFGFGLNNYLDLTYRDFPFEFNSNFFLCNPIHNAYLLYAVEIGIVGSIIFVMFLINNYRYIFKIIKYKSKEVTDAVKGYGALILVYMIYNLQGWGGIQNRTLITVIITSALIYNNYNRLKNKVIDKEC